MNWEAWVTILTVGLVLFVLARDLARPDTVLLGGMTILMSFSMLSDRFPSPREMAGSFGNEGLLTVGVLFVVASALTRTGALGLMTEPLLGRPKTVTSAQLRMMLPVTAFSTILNNTPVVAMFVPVINDWCKKARLSPSKLMMPLSYAAILGGVCTLIGTSTNLVVQGLMIEVQKRDPSSPIMGMFTIGKVGVPVAIVGIVYLLVASRRLLPERKPASVEMGDTRQYTVEMMVRPGSAVDGQTIEQAGLRNLPGMYLIEIQRGGDTLSAVGPEARLHGGDQLVFVGVVESVVDLRNIRGLTPATTQVFKLNSPRHNRVLIEAVVSNTCPLVGQTIREGRFRTRYDAAVIAVHRNGRRLNQKIGDIALEAGDTLLLETHPRFVEHNRNSRDFYLVSALEDSQPRHHEKAWVALLILLGMVSVAAAESFTGVSIFNAALIAGGLLVLTRCITMDQARKSVDWSVLLAIGAALGVGRAMETSGAAEFMAGGMIRTILDDLHLGPWGVLAGIYLITLLFTEVVTNNAAAALMFPIAHAAASALGVNFMPFAITIAVAASSGFATPMGYATHLMVYGPGGYRFSDFLRFGIPLDLIIATVAITLIPLLFPFTT